MVLILKRLDEGSDVRLPHRHQRTVRSGNATVNAIGNQLGLKSIPGCDQLPNATFDTGCSSEPAPAGSCGQSERLCRVKPVVTSLFGCHFQAHSPFGNLFVTVSIGRLAVATESIIVT